MFRKVLVANRGEIAARVLRACREMKIRTVAVHSEADASSPHLKLADERICIGGSRAAESYLNVDAVLQAAEQTECQAVHPGYGFLAENATFSARCASHRVTFIGPGPAAMRRMGDKVEARRTMAAAGVPVIPGTLDALDSVEDAVREASAAGYPVMIKAVAGGGGRGMRRCENEKDLRKNFPEAAAEAEAAFGNPALYLEKYIEGGRHIEFQILADGQGGAVHLGERECSVQRNHQKLIEEAPSPVLTAEERLRIGALVAKAAATIGYAGAGTMEFLRDRDGSLYFMEMNARLQVEHPITEEISGIDIVQGMIRIAAGERLWLSQEEVTFDGHAIECRINAEDPSAGFKPSPGTVETFDLEGGPGPVFGKAGANPAGREPRLRLESHVEAGYSIPPHYDSLIAKAIAWGPDRNAALDAMSGALKKARIRGIHTTVPFHVTVLANELFRAGDYDVTLVDKLLPSAGAER